nr:RNA polymerase sporulation sigma factor SigG [bacterium]
MQKVDLCGVDTSQLPVIPNQKMDELLKKVQFEKSRAARQELIEGNLRLVLSVIQRFANRGEAADDLFQVGCIGLMKSIDNFDTRMNVRFSTYAVPMIIGEIRRFLRDNNALRVSRSLRDLAYKAMQTRERLTRERGEEPGVLEIARELDLPAEEVAAALEAIQDPLSLQEPLGNDGGEDLLLMDQIQQPGEMEQQWVEDIALNQAMSALPQREQKIIKMRFFDGRTQMEVAQEIGISQAQVSRLEKGALLRIRKQI